MSVDANTAYAYTQLLHEPSMSRLVGLSAWDSSAVGHPFREFAWILACGESLDGRTLQQIALVLEGGRYGTCDLLMTRPESLERLCAVAG